MTATPEIRPCLGFDAEAEEAVNFDVSLIPDSRIPDIARYGEVGPGKPGSAMMVSFELGELDDPRVVCLSQRRLCACAWRSGERPPGRRVAPEKRGHFEDDGGIFCNSCPCNSTVPVIP